MAAVVRRFQAGKASETWHFKVSLEEMNWRRVGAGPGAMPRHGMTAARVRMRGQVPETFQRQGRAEQWERNGYVGLQSTVLGHDEVSRML